ncbi:MAG: hypothetical protein Tsb0034_29930 [Ekhidna sp.]
MKRTILLIVLMIGTARAWAQEQETAHNQDLWFLQLSKLYLKNGWGLENELHLRLADYGSEKQQVLIRPSVFYQLNQSVTFHLGYTHIETYPYGEQPVPIQTPENNLWAQVTLSHEVVGVQISHRYRLEERWTGKAVTSNNETMIDGVQHRNRFRYRLTAKKPIGKGYIAAFDEVWFNFGENTGLNRMDQNWVYAGYGRNLNSKLALEVGYLHQWIAKADGYRFESNNTVQFTAHLKISKANNQKQ